MNATTAAAALYGASRLEVRRAAHDAEGGWEVIGRGYSGRVIATAWVATKAEADALMAAARV